MAIYSLSGVVRFGIFEFDTGSRQLSRKGIRIRLPQQPIQVLSVLLERSGEVVTREELRKLLWPADVFVDFDLGLNKSIQKLREALGDSPASPRFIETIPRFGYRFIAPVITDVASENLVPQVPAASATINLPGKSKVLWFSLAG